MIAQIAFWAAFAVTTLIVTIALYKYHVHRLEYEYKMAKLEHDHEILATDGGDEE